MNPLDMTGPEFLRFYLAWGLGGLLLAWGLRTFWLNKIESPADARRWNPGYYPEDSEAYAIALLRGGRKEAVRILMGRLASLGLVAVHRNKLRRIPNREKERRLLSIESTALHAVSHGGPASTAEAEIESAVEPELEALELDLERQGLVPSASGRRSFRILQGLALLAVCGLGLAKLAVAVGRERPNIGFLLILLGIYTVAALLVLKPPRLTPAGRGYLEWLQESHAELMRQIANKKGEQEVDIAMAAGIFGLAAVPALADAFGPRRQKIGDEYAFWGAGDSGNKPSSGEDGGGDDGGGGDGGGDGGGGCGGCGGGD
ncbi:MAG TPA: TIGR04222 domain-containing membrane protein [Thermoanaerobaculia bacterium]|nr:TIGR04222 domain-containing membrane protein [Thermoanaerobaculia bacterium]